MNPELFEAYKAILRLMVSKDLTKIEAMNEWNSSSALRISKIETEQVMNSLPTLFQVRLIKNFCEECDK